MSDLALIQQHAGAIQAAILAAHADLDSVQNERLRDECRRALDTTHDVADGAFRRLTRRCPAETDGVTLLSGGGK